MADVDKLLARAEEIKLERDRAEAESAGIGAQEYLAEVRAHNAGEEGGGVGTLPSDDGYDSLRAVYDQALEQAQGGKGLERHANGLPFDQQPICQGGRRFGVGCLVYQAWKKSHETPVLLALDNGKERAVRELLGVINYAAAAIIVLQEDKS